MTKSTLILLSTLLIASVLSIPDGWCDPNWCHVDPDCIHGCGGPGLTKQKKNGATLKTHRYWTQKYITLQVDGGHVNCEGGKLTGPHAKAEQFEVHPAGDKGRVYLSIRGRDNSIRYLFAKKKKNGKVKIGCNAKNPFYFSESVLREANLEFKNGKLFWLANGGSQRNVKVTAGQKEFKTRNEAAVREPDQCSVTFDSKPLTCKDGVLKVGTLGEPLKTSDIVNPVPPTLDTTRNIWVYAFQLTTGKYLTINPSESLDSRTLTCDSTEPEKFFRLSSDVKSKPNSFRGYFAKDKQGTIIMGDDKENDKMQFQALAPLYLFEVDGKMVLKPRGQTGAMHCANSGYLELDPNDSSIDSGNKFTVTRFRDSIALSQGGKYVGVSNGYLKCGFSSASTFDAIVGEGSTEGTKEMVLMKNFQYVTLSGSKLKLESSISNNVYFSNIAPVLTAKFKRVDANKHDEL